jgi:hypothetical protein
LIIFIHRKLVVEAGFSRLRGAGWFGCLYGARAEGFIRRQNEPPPFQGEAAEQAITDEEKDA